MLSAADADVARREPALPGLATVLDPEALSLALNRALPDAGVTGARLTYVKYKPGTNALVGCRLQTGAGEVLAHVQALPGNAIGRLLRAREAVSVAGPLGSGRLVIDELGLVVSFFPNDRRLPGLARFGHGVARPEALRELLAVSSVPGAAGLATLVYKPERRYVARLETPAGALALKLYDRSGYAAARLAATAFAARGPLRFPRLRGASDLSCALAFEWLPGQGLNELLAGTTLDPETMTLAGAALAEVHAQDPAGLRSLTRHAEADALLAVANAVAVVAPGLRLRARDLATRLAARLEERSPVGRPVHGDFYAKQVLVSPDAVAFLDFDEARRGDPALDLGNFVAHLERSVLHGELSSQKSGPAGEALLQGYVSANRGRLPEAVELQTAARLFRLAADPFRQREPDWPRRIADILDRVQALLAAVSEARVRPTRPPRGPGHRTSTVTVLDPLDAAADPALPSLAGALDPSRAEPALQRLGWPNHTTATLRLLAIRVTRHKPRRRALVEYDVEVSGCGRPAEVVTLLGKVRAKGADERTFRLHQVLWQSGFAADSASRVSVPEPVGLCPELGMWLQRKVSGTLATHLVALPGGAILARRIAEALAAFHRGAPLGVRMHGIQDELRILLDRLALLAEARPRWRARLEGLGSACTGLAVSLPAAPPRALHRDFHPDQVLVDGDRLWLLDLDLQAQGNGALDAGNFAAHLVERSLSHPRSASSLSTTRRAFVKRFAELESGAGPGVIEAWETLSLARHVQISTLMPERRPYTEALLDHCEERLALAARSSNQRPPLALQAR